ncbi:hypothetical protein CC78DRAFT_584814 [Lojkania enalia]|uniref:N-acetylgalactosaminide beta-1,3-galactosyltransferase n=1 Tax=Lojkania enalia TaxID=147567 RepID=A0A9P4K5A7_9PLEO|nr:hypothetical protein CC78DRAFT_584814 [Didymosphaeria enalia]
MALRSTPQAKWYIFIEADTYLLWPNLVAYLSHLDTSKNYYIGKHMYIGDILFAHGGSGFVLSESATRNAFPHFQGDSVESLDFGMEKVGGGHGAMRRLLGVICGSRGAGAIVTYSDVFKGIVLQKLREKILDWDNLFLGNEYSVAALGKMTEQERHGLSDLEKKAAEGFEDCRRACEGKWEWYPGTLPCVEYNVAASKCVEGAERATGNGRLASGWIIDRVKQYMEDMDHSCLVGQAQWVK